MDLPDVQASCFGALFSRTTTRSASSVTRSSLPNSSSERPNWKSQGRDNDPSAIKFQQEEDINYFNPFCDFSYGPRNERWNIQHEAPPAYAPKGQKIHNADDISALMEQVLDNHSPNLRELSLKIHDHPELMFKEKYAHGLLTDFMEKQGFKVTKHYLGLDTAWRAEYSQGKGGRTIGINSEMDALPAIGHACGHNLIAISGVGVAIALKAALEARPHVPGKIVLLGTPAEEGGGGKIILLKRGAYAGMDACVMCHPTTGFPHSTAITTTTAMQSLTVEYFGHSAHAGGAPWEGTNALDAAFLAYSSLSMLRQQIKPDHRMHGVIEGKNWAPNVIPDYAKMRWIARAPSFTEVESLMARVINCFKAGAVATGCRIEIKLENAYFDLHQNSVLAQDFIDIVKSRYGLISIPAESSASTDFGNISYALPSLHPSFAIPTVPNGGNHTPAFAKAASSKEAHAAAIAITKGLALTSYRVLTDADFFSKVQASFEQDKLTRG